MFVACLPDCLPACPTHCSFVYTIRSQTDFFFSLLLRFFYYYYLFLCSILGFFSFVLINLLPVHSNNILSHTHMHAHMLGKLLHIGRITGEEKERECCFCLHKIKSVLWFGHLWATISRRIDDERVQIATVNGRSSNGDHRYRWFSVLPFSVANRTPHITVDFNIKLQILIDLELINDI